MPKLTNILLIRHAEKPRDTLDRTLTLVGLARSHAYVAYFQHYTVGQSVIRLDHLFAASDSAGSVRSTMTLAPLSSALGLTVDTRFEDKDTQRLSDEIRNDNKYDHSNILICWHHGQLLDLATALGAARPALPPIWPADVFGWMVHLNFDATGACDTRVFNQQLMFGDCGQAV